MVSGTASFTPSPATVPNSSPSAAEVVKRQVSLLYRVADPAYGVGVATRMGLAASDLPTAQAAE
jgi:hypothetical protein